MKNNQKGFASIVLIGAVVALMAIGGYFILSRKSQPVTETKADAETYINKEFGFSIVPPKGWYTNTKEMLGSSVAFFEKDGGQVVNKEFNPTLAVSYTLDDKSNLEQNVAQIKKVYSGASDEYKPISDNVIVIDGHSARVIESSLTMTINYITATENCVKCKFKLRKLDVVMADGKGKIYYLAATVLESDWAKYKDLIANSQKTFKFTNPATQTSDSKILNWKTYTNSQYGLEFKYPKDYTVGTEGGYISIKKNNNVWGHINISSNTGSETEAQEIKKIKNQILSTANARLISENPRTIDGHNITQIVAFFPEAGSSQNIYNFVFVGVNKYEVSFFPFDKTMPYDQILSTFKFTEMTSQTLNDDMVIKPLLASWTTTQSKFESKAGESGIYNQPDKVQFISNDAFLVHYDDGLVDHISLLQYQDGAFIELKNVGVMSTIPFLKWQALVKIYGGQNFPISNYTKDIVRNGKNISFKELTKVPENVFIKFIQ